QVRKNFDAFERALSMFAPFQDAADAHEGGQEGEKGAEGDKGPKAQPGEDDIDKLKAELQAMQKRLEELSRE
ncbi:MAG: polyhydroxyalkanoate synthesis repressor PhaR, partial [Alphaproteobacteria bacterium]